MMPTTARPNVITEPTVRLCWSEHAIRRCAEVLRESGLQRMSEQMEAFLPLPLPVPAKIGAVVRTSYHEALVRTCLDNDLITEWRAPDGRRFSTNDIGRITEVLSPGVEL